MPTLTFRAGVAAAAAALVVSGCGNSGPQAPTGEAACTKVDVPLLDVGTRTDTEPRVRIPQPPGWERYTEMDSDVVRAALINKALTADKFTPNVVYTLDTLPNTVDATQALAQERDGLERMGGATDLEVTESTVCGLPGQTVHYMLKVPKRAAAHPTIMREAVLTNGDNTYVVTLTIQTTKPDDPTFQKDSTAILDGMQVLPPAKTE